MPFLEHLTNKISDERDHGHDASHRFHLEVNLSDEDAKKILTIGAAAGVAALFAVGSKTRLGSEIAERSVPLLEDGLHDVLAGAIKLVKNEPKLNYFELKSGVECSLSKGVSFLNQQDDLISIVHPLGDEVHLLRMGSRAVIKGGIHCFYDQAGVGVHMPTQNELLPDVLFENKSLTPINRRLFGKVENCFWTGYLKPLNRISDLVEKAGRF